jgi:hypothetical protein
MAAYTRISSAQAKCAVIHNCMLASAAAAISLAATPAGLAAPFFTNYNNTNGLAQNSQYGVYASGDSIYTANSSTGVSISTDGGASWVTRNTANSGLASNSLYGLYGDGGSIYVATAPSSGIGGGLSVSTNGGTSWTNYTNASKIGRAHV